MQCNKIAAIAGDLATNVATHDRRRMIRHIVLEFMMLARCAVVTAMAGCLFLCGELRRHNLDGSLTEGG